MIIRNARVRTMDPDQPLADSVTVVGNRIEAVGVGGHGEQVVDAKGLCVVPGFTDSHAHFPSWALSRQQPRLDGARSIDEVIRRLVDAPRPCGWVRGVGWSESDWDDPVAPTKAHLDDAIGEQPVALMSKDYHSLWLNSAALAVARGDLPRDGGVVEMDANGEPTGILREEAAWQFRDAHVRPTHAEMVSATGPAIEIANARGVTAIHDKDGWLDVMPVWRELHAADALSMRVWQSYPPAALEDLERLRVDDGAAVRLGYIKVFMDGTVGSGTALMSDGSGVEITSERGLVDAILHAAEHDLAVGVHAIGDLANTRALNAFEATYDIWARKGLRPRVEHAQLLSPADVTRFAALGVSASVQFMHAPSDRDRADAFLEGRDIVAYGFRSLLDAGAVLANGSDAPVEDLDPLRGIKAGATRTLDERPPWRESERISVYEALRATTESPAWLAHDEDRRGRIRSGYLADFVVLDRDPVVAAPDELGDVEVVATMFDGRWVHNPPPW